MPSPEKTTSPPIPRAEVVRLALEQTVGLDAAVDPKWRDDAACRGMNPELFFSEEPLDTEKAKRICGDCSVRTACFITALESGEPGTRGGITEKERSNLLRRTKRIEKIRRIKLLQSTLVS